MKRMLLMVAVLTIASVQAHAINLITNGSFETGYAGPSNFWTLAAGSTALTGWNVEPNGIDWIYQYWTAQDGTHSIDLSGNNPGGVSQGFATTAGEKYHVDFWLAGNKDGPPETKTVDVTVAIGAYAQVFSWTGTKGQWKQSSFDFAATGTWSTLKFMSTTGTAYGPALDNVSVTDTGERIGSATPELSTWALLGCSGLFGVGLLRRRRTA